MSSNIIYPQGGLAVDINVPSGDSISIFTRDKAVVYEMVGYPNQPVSRNEIGTVINSEQLFGPFADGAILRIHAGADDVLYQVGLSPSVTELKGLRAQGTPGVLDATGTLTAALMLTGIVTSSTAAAVTATLDTGALMDSAAEFDVGESFDWSVVNTGANAFTVTASTGHTVVGNGVVSGSESDVFRTQKTADETFVTYRIG